MTRPRQPDLFATLTAEVIEEVAELPSGSLHQFSGENCEPRSLDDVPLIFRLPGEPGYIELDSHYRPVAK